MSPNPNTKPLQNPNETIVTGLSLKDLHGSDKTTGLYFSLTVIEGNDFGYVIQLDKGETVLGRKDIDSSADIQINDIRSSRRHLLLIKRQIETQDNSAHVFAVDLDSKNGTFLNGKQMPKNEVELRNGDKLLVGDTVLKFEIKDRLETSYQERLYQQVSRDQLTGLWNHNYARQEIEKLISMGTRHNWPFALLLIELDFFQTLNETYGQAVGDAVLRAIAQTLSAKIGAYDTLARFAGRQFLMLLPETDMETAANIAENLRQEIEAFDFSSCNYPQRLTCSIGIAQFPLNGRAMEALIKQADEALYHAKQVGRNRVMKATHVETTISTNKTKRIIAIVGILLGVLLAVGIASRFAFRPASKPVKQPIAFSGTVQSKEIEVGSKIGGRVSEVLVEEGQVIEAGKPLVRFDVSDLMAERAKTEAKISEAKAKLAKLEHGYRREEIDEAEAATAKAQATLEELRNGPRLQEITQVKAYLAAAESDLTNAEVVYARKHAIYLKGYLAKQEDDEAETRKNIASAQVQALKEKLSLLEAGTRPEQIRAAEENYKEALASSRMLNAGSRSEDIDEAKAQLGEAEGELKKIDTQIAEGQLLTPAKSYVEIVSVRPGDLVPPSKIVIRLIEEDQTWVRIYVPETDMGKIYVGQKASITIDTFPDKIFSGHVSQISEDGEFTPRNIQTPSGRSHEVFGVKIDLDAKDKLLKSGMAADAKLESRE